MNRTIKNRIEAIERAEGVSERDTVFVHDDDPAPADLGNRRLVRIVHEIITPDYRKDGTVIPRLS
jgi:hypothetical protein